MAIEIKDLKFSYPGRNVLQGLNLSIEDKAFVGITGPTGSGKTTLAYCLNGLIPHSIMGKFRGSVNVCGLDTSKHKVAELARKVGLVFQDPDLQLFSLTVRDEVSFGLKNLHIPNLEQRVNRALKLVGLQGYEQTEPHNMSQGQRQKLCIASIIAMEPDVIVLDEPTSSLDYRSTINIYDILKGLHREGKTVIVIEHDTDLLFKYAKTVSIMDEGRVVKYGPSHEVFSEKNMLKKLGIKIPGACG
jgi:energy-coupling factor transporter ATP-binding protein EcfA2